MHTELLAPGRDLWRLRLAGLVARKRAPPGGGKKLVRGVGGELRGNF